MEACADSHYPPCGPLVSIITPAYKAQETLSWAVESVITQSYANWEMLIVNDDGTDYEGTLKANGIRDQRLRFITTGKIKSGPNRSRNIALEAAKGEFIATEG
jgi:glycosyltransferase involved in cell wall biosynthesis